MFRKVLFYGFAPAALCCIAGYHACNPRGTAGDIHWEKGPAPQNGYEYNLALTDGADIYVLGGFNEGSFEVFRTRTQQWESLPAMPAVRAFPAGVCLDRAIYVAGGVDKQSHTTAAVEQFDLDLGAWSYATDLPSPRDRLAAVGYRGRLYCIGGMESYAGRIPVNTSRVDMYDPAGDKWVSLPDIPTARHGHAAVVLHDKIFVMGGYTGQGETGIVEALDLATQQWHTMSAMMVPRGFFGAVTDGRYIYALCGRVDGGTCPAERYDPATDTWTLLDAMPVWKNRFGIAYLSGRIYLAGGEDSPSDFYIGTLTAGRQQGK